MIGFNFVNSSIFSTRNFSILIAEIWEKIGICVLMFSRGLLVRSGRVDLIHEESSEFTGSLLYQSQISEHRFLLFSS